MRSILSLLIVATIAAMAQAQSIDGPDEIEAGKPAWFAIADVPASANAGFFPSSRLTADSRVAKAHAMFWTDTPGTYEIHASVVWATVNPDKTTVTIEEIRLAKTVTVTGEAPSDPFQESVRRTVEQAASIAGGDPLIVAPEGLCEGPSCPLQPPGGNCSGGKCRNCR